MDAYSTDAFKAKHFNFNDKYLFLPCKRQNTKRLQHSYGMICSIMSLENLSIEPIHHKSSCAYSLTSPILDGIIKQIYTSTENTSLILLPWHHNLEENYRNCGRSPQFTIANHLQYKGESSSSIKSISILAYRQTGSFMSIMQEDTAKKRVTFTRIL